MGQVVALTEPTERDARLVIRASEVTDAKPGASVAINGVCLTVLPDSPSSDLLSFDIMPQTLKLTGLGSLQAGDFVNLERAMLAGARFDGHVVQGHVDGQATLISRESDFGDDAAGEVVPGRGPDVPQRWDTLRFQLPANLLQYLAPQGSITVDGVSLTVSELHDDGFSVSLIPTTLALTTLGQLQPGSQVNIETDALAKYAARLAAARVSAGALTVTKIAEAELPTAWGSFRIHAFRDSKGFEHVALVKGELSRSVETNDSDAPLVRVHSECLTGDAFASLRCDCGPQLHTAMQLVAEHGGAVLYLRGQEGRGIGLAAKIAAYALQDEGSDTVEANQQLGLPVDARDYSAAIAMLNELGLTRLRLLTNNPAKVEALSSHGIEVIERVPIEVGLSATNEFYLKTKRDQMGHYLYLKNSEAQ